MKILNFGSLNIDHVYRTPHIVNPGETLASRSYDIFAGGKGANQSVALARAGAPVHHAGKLGQDGAWLKQKLADSNVNTDLVVIDSNVYTGHAIIQVDDAGENAIVLHPGANHQVTDKEITYAINQFAPGDILLLQNEINDIPQIIQAAVSQKLTVCFNPAPFTPEVHGYPLDLVDTLILNETEAANLADLPIDTAPDIILDTLVARYPKTTLILTQGGRGVIARVPGQTDITLPAEKVTAVDTTAAGDTFIGYYLAAVAQNLDIATALKQATRAAALCVTRPGATDSIPTADELQ